MSQITPAGGSSSSIATPPPVASLEGSAWYISHPPSAPSGAVSGKAIPTQITPSSPRISSEHVATATVIAPVATAPLAACGTKDPGSQAAKHHGEHHEDRPAVHAAPQQRDSPGDQNDQKQRSNDAAHQDAHDFPSTIAINCSAVFRKGRMSGSADTRIRNTTLFAASSSSRAVLV